MTGVCVCVVGVDSSQENKRTQNRETDRDKQHKEVPNKHKKRPSLRRGEANNTKKDKRQRNEQNQPRKKRGAGGRRQAEASRKGERTSGKAAGAEGENRRGQEGGQVQL